MVGLAGLSRRLSSREPCGSHVGFDKLNLLPPLSRTSRFSALSPVQVLNKNPLWSRFNMVGLAGLVTP